jgi:hypothetical protein
MPLSGFAAPCFSVRFVRLKRLRYKTDGNVSILSARADSIMTLWKDLIDIPESPETFVHVLSSGLDNRRHTVDSYVVTDSLADRFDDALSMIRSGLAVDTPGQPSSKGAFLHGSFGSGKSHFMTILGLLLDNYTPARELDNLASAVKTHKDWMDETNLLKIPFHLLGAPSIEAAVLGGYVEYIEEHHEDAALPGVYVADSVLENAEELRADMGDEKFFDILNEGKSGSGWGDFEETWDADSYQRALEAGPDTEEKEKLVGDVVDKFLSSVRDSSLSSGKGFVNFDRGLSIISRHAKGLGYDGVLLFLDELILWLSRKAAEPDFVNNELQKVPKLVEAQHSDRPVPLFSFIARQRDLSEMVGDVFTGEQKTTLNLSREWGAGRFSEIELEDRNLPYVAHKRLLDPKGPEEKELVQQSFDRIFENLNPQKRRVMQTSQHDREDFRRIYPFSPALMRALVVLSNELQRERTALKIMQALLMRQRDRLELGEIIPVGDLWPLLAEGEEPFDPVKKRLFRSAKDLYELKLVPMLEREHDVEKDELEPGDPGWQSFQDDLRIVHTLLVAALVPKLEIFENMTPERLLALNHGTISAPIPGAEKSQILQKLRTWSTEVSEIHLGDPPNQTVELRLEGVDIEPLIEAAAPSDNLGARRRKVKELLYEWMGLEEGRDLRTTYEIPWRGDDRDVEVAYRNIREQSFQQMQPVDEGPLVAIDYPFDEPDYSARQDKLRMEEFREQYETTHTVAWLPTFLTGDGQRLLGRLVRIDAVLDHFDDYATDLRPDDRPVAKRQLKSNRDAIRTRLHNALHTAYGLSEEHTDLLDLAVQVDHLESLAPGHAPDVPVGQEFPDALDKIARDALEVRYPEAFDLPDERLRPAAVKEMQRAIRGSIDSEEDSYRVDEPQLRRRLRQFAQPLKLGEMGETRFSHSNHWSVQIERELEPDQRLEVGDIYDLLDPADGRTGLPQLLMDLVVLTYADMEDMGVERGGQSLADPAPGDLRGSDELAQRRIPDEEDWEAAREVASKIFGVEPPKMCNARSVQRFAREMREAAEGQKVAARQIRDRLMQLLPTHLGMTKQAVRETTRWQNAARLRELMDALDHEDATDLVEAVAAVELDDDSYARLEEVLSEAQPILDALNDTRWDLFDEIVDMGDERSAALDGLLDEAREVVSVSEVGTSIEQLLDIEKRILRVVLDKPDDPPPPPVEPTLIASGVFETEGDKALDEVTSWLRDNVDGHGDETVEISIDVKKPGEEG